MFVFESDLDDIKRKISNIETDILNNKCSAIQRFAEMQQEIDKLSKSCKKDESNPLKEAESVLARLILTQICNGDLDSAGLSIEMLSDIKKITINTEKKQ